MDKKIKILGIVCLILGSLAAILCIVPYGLFLALPVGFVGMICSSIYVYIDTKYTINTKKITSGIVGVILSSIPILMILTIMIIRSFSS